MNFVHTYGHDCPLCEGYCVAGAQVLRATRPTTPDGLTLIEIVVKLHTVNGDVTTSYTPAQINWAYDTITQYLHDGKSFSVEQVKA